MGMAWKDALKALKGFCGSNMGKELEGLEESLKGWETRDEHREGALKSWKDADAALRAERDTALLQNQELQNRLDRKDHDLYLYWKEGFEKMGFPLHAGLTPEQNAAEWREACEAESKRAWDERKHYRDESMELRVKLEQTNRLNGEYRKLLESLYNFGMNAGNWTGSLESTSWNMTPAEDKYLDQQWEYVAELLSKTEKRKDEADPGWPQVLL